MPLAKGKSKAVISGNVREMEANGHSHAQSVAAALHTAHPHKAAASEGEFTHPLVHADWADEHGQQDHADVLHVLGTHGPKTVRVLGDTHVVHFLNPKSDGNGLDVATIRVMGRDPTDWWRAWQGKSGWQWGKYDFGQHRHVPAKAPPHIVDAFHEAVAQLAPHRKRLARVGAARQYAKKPATSESFIAALKDMKTKKQAARREVAHTVAQQAGIVPHTIHDAVHDRVDGRATPSVVHHYPAAPSADTARYSAAWFGLITGLEGVAVFFPDPKGPDFLYEFHATGSGEMLRQRLDRAGIGDRVLMPKRGGFTVMVLDEGGRMGDRVRKYAGGNVTAMRGRAERMGGDNPVQAREEYRKLIKGYEGGGATQKARVRGGLRRYAEDDVEHQYDPHAEEKSLAANAPPEIYADWLAENGHPEHEASMRAVAAGGIPRRSSLVVRVPIRGKLMWVRLYGSGMTRVESDDPSFLPPGEKWTGTRVERAFGVPRLAWSGGRHPGGSWRWRDELNDPMTATVTPPPHVSEAFWDAVRQVQARGK